MQADAGLPELMIKLFESLKGAEVDFVDGGAGEDDLTHRAAGDAVEDAVLEDAGVVEGQALVDADR